jgi:hypothetical protein
MIKYNQDFYLLKMKIKEMIIRMNLLENISSNSKDAKTYSMLVDLKEIRNKFENIIKNKEE